MSEVNITRLRQALPAYLKRVRKGERIQVTSHGRVIAEIVPPVANGKETSAALARLRGSLVKYNAPYQPVIPPAEWEMNR